MAVRDKLKAYPLLVSIFLILSGGILSYYTLVMPRERLRALQHQYIEVKPGGAIVVTDVAPGSWYKPSKHFQGSSMLVKSIVLSEDWAFFQHHGVDINQLYHSIKDALMGDTLRGASTITQQVIKNIFFNSKRSYVRKFHELFYALYLEQVLTKEKILTLYLNLVELGPGLYGVHAASYYYFDKGPDALNAREAAFLTMLLPSPIKYGESFRRKQLTPFAKSSLDRLLGKMVLAKVLTSEERNYYLELPFAWEKKYDDALEVDRDSNEDHEYDNDGYDKDEWQDKGNDR